MPTPTEIADQMVKALSITEPDLDTGVGTPIRKVLDVVSEAIAEAYVDRYLLQYQYDIDSKSGADLDAFVALFGFARLPAKRASGAILLQRSSPAPSSIFVPAGSQVATVDSPPIVVQTAAPAVFPQGAITASVAVQAVVGGSNGNLSSNLLIRWMTPIEGIVAVTNPAPLTGGADAETDDQLKERFRRSIFRNLAGTEDMFLGIALNDDNVTGATVIGPSERWREQIQVTSGTAVSTITSPSVLSYTLNNASNTTPISIGTVAAHPYVPGDIVVISGVLGNLAANGTFRVKTVGGSTTFTLSKLDGSGDVAGTGAYTAATGTVKQSDRAKWIYDTGYAFGSNIDAGAILTPGVHYTLNTATIPPTVTSIDPVNCPDGIYDLTYNYCPTSSRNDPPVGITNRIDVYTDGARPRVATETSILDGRIIVTDYGTTLAFHRWKRPDGTYPTIGHAIMRLSFPPVIDVPNTLPAIGTMVAPTEGTNWWLLNEVREPFQGYASYSAIEFDNITLPTFKNLASSTNANPTVLQTSGAHIFTVGMRVIIENHAVNTAANGVHTVTAVPDSTHITIDAIGNGIGTASGTISIFHPVSPGYTYNAIPRDVQVKTEAWRILGTDLVSHHGNQFNLKIYAAVILKPGYTVAAIQSAVNTAVTSYLATLKFGGILQISDLSNAIGDVTGIDAVRLLNSSDMTGALTITTSAGTPIQVTTSVAHGLVTGDLVQIDGVLGNTNTNGLWLVNFVNTTNFTLRNSSTNAAYTSGGSAYKANYAIQRIEDNGVNIRWGYSTAPTTAPHRAVDVYALDNEYFALQSIVLTVKAANTFGAV